jgi:hypothetical protein
MLEGFRKADQKRLQLLQDSSLEVQDSSLEDFLLCEAPFLV